MRHDIKCCAPPQSKTVPTSFQLQRRRAQVPFWRVFPVTRLLATAANLGSLRNTLRRLHFQAASRPLPGRFWPLPGRLRVSKAASADGIAVFLLARLKWAEPVRHPSSRSTPGRAPDTQWLFLTLPANPEPISNAHQFGAVAASVASRKRPLPRSLDRAGHARRPHIPRGSLMSDSRPLRRINHQGGAIGGQPSAMTGKGSIRAAFHTDCWPRVPYRPVQTAALQVGATRLQGVLATSGYCYPIRVPPLEIS